MNAKGFTLIELMIVVAIIGIMGSYALPNFTNKIVSKQVNEGILLGNDYQEMVVEYYRLHGKFPANNAALNMPPANKILGNYTTGVAVENGAIHISYGNYIHKAVDGKILSLRPMTVPGSPNSPVGWACGHRAPPEGMQENGQNKTNILPNLVPLKCM